MKSKEQKYKEGVGRNLENALDSLRKKEQFYWLAYTFGHISFPAAKMKLGVRKNDTTYDDQAREIWKGAQKARKRAEEEPDYLPEITWSDLKLF